MPINAVANSTLDQPQKQQKSVPNGVEDSGGVNNREKGEGRKGGEQSGTEAAGEERKGERGEEKEKEKEKEQAKQQQHTPDGADSGIGSDSPKAPSQSQQNNAEEPKHRQQIVEDPIEEGEAEEEEEEVPDGLGFRVESEFGRIGTKITWFFRDIL